MTKRAFDQIAAGLEEAIAIARGEAQPARLHIPPRLNVEKIRSKTGLSRPDFARRFGFDTDQIATWEQGSLQPSGGERAYLMMIDLDYEAVSRIFEQARKIHDEIDPVAGAVAFDDDAGRAKERAPGRPR